MSSAGAREGDATGRRYGCGRRLATARTVRNAQLRHLAVTGISDFAKGRRQPLLNPAQANGEKELTRLRLADDHIRGHLGVDIRHQPPQPVGVDTRHHDDSPRPATRDARSAHLAYARRRAPPWVGNLRANSGNVEGRLAGQPRLAVSRTASPGAAGMDCLRMGNL